MDTDKLDLQLRDLLPRECWEQILTFLPRLSRQNLSHLYGFKEIIDDTLHLEDRRLYHALKNGNLRWNKVHENLRLPPRLRHGSINFNDQLIVFGGSSGNSGASGTYNDVWKFDFQKKFHRMTTLGSEIPSPRANFGFLKVEDKIFTVGGRSSSNVDPFMIHQNPFEVHMLNPVSGAWQKVITTGNEPKYSNGARAVMLSSNEILTITGSPATSWMQEVNPEGNYENPRATMQVCLLNFTDSSMSRATWYSLAEWSHNRRGMPMPRGEFHLVSIGNDNVLMIGGCSTSQILQDAWILKITKHPSYSLKWVQVTIENPLYPSLPLNLFPSCLIRDLLVFTGVRTLMRKPGIEKPKEETKKPTQEPAITAPSSSSSSTTQVERKTPIYINLDRPINTIGTMAAFSVAPQPAVPPQKVLKIQVTPEPSPEPPRKRRQDYPMRIFCLDLSCIINGNDEMFRTNPTVNPIRWLELKNNGLFENAPELRAHGTFTQFENGIALVGGVRRSQVDDGVLFTQATNEVYILDYVDET